ncbi:alpha-tocopherol transfer protein-like [Diabrotica virgifera virgifera]|uniref:CRAL-TRIO domain-containing protein n=2 Tax=Diabrotica virgifera virgifera TaxID=50390 RepID=A0ABM5KD23_DIAVI|nr:alpha-tocopherol transfer protein-like [Diabrotica virgifera virgifera]
MTSIESLSHCNRSEAHNMVEFILATTKFSPEIAKKKLDNYYTIRSIYPNYFNNLNPKLPYVQNAFNAGYVLPLPKIVNEMYRVVIIKPKEKSESIFNVTEQLYLVLDLYEIRMHEDLMAGDIVVFDMNHLSLGHVLKVSPMFVKASVTILENMYSTRIKEVHILNYPSVFDKLLAIAKLFIKPKLYDRLKLHSSFESFLNYVPLEVLPKDYGGEEKSMDELEKMLKLKLIEYGDRFDKLDTLRVNESLRPTAIDCQENFGVHGTFRQMNID